MSVDDIDYKAHITSSHFSQQNANHYYWHQVKWRHFGFWSENLEFHPKLKLCVNLFLRPAFLGDTNVLLVIPELKIV